MYRKVGIIFICISVLFVVLAVKQVEGLFNEDLFTLAAHYKDYTKNIWTAFSYGCASIFFGRVGMRFIK